MIKTGITIVGFEDGRKQWVKKCRQSLEGGKSKEMKKRNKRILPKVFREEPSPADTLSLAYDSFQTYDL